MIKQVSLRNFQSHVETDIEFCEGVNVIVGGSDEGKTSILRGINWTALNLPKGKAFHSFPHLETSDETSVKVVLPEGEVERRRSNTENLYVAKGEEFQGGSGVPEAVSGLLNLHPRINIQNQMDAPFLLQESPGEVGRLVNELVHLESIDKTLSKLRSIRREEEKERKRLAAEIEEDIEAVDALSESVEAVRQPVYSLEPLLVSLEEKERNVADLKSAIEGLEDWQRKALKANGVASLAENAKGIDESLKQLKEAEGNVSRLKTAVADVEENQKFVEEVGEFLAFGEKASGIEKAMADLKEIEARNANLSQAIKQHEQATRKAEKKEALVANLQAEFDELMPDVCPLCGKENG